MVSGGSSREREQRRGANEITKVLVSRVTYADHILWIVRLHDAMALHSRRFKLYTTPWGWSPSDVVEPKFGRFSITNRDRLAARGLYSVIARSIAEMNSIRRLNMSLASFRNVCVRIVKKKHWKLHKAPTPRQMQNTGCAMRTWCGCTTRNLLWDYK